MASSNIKLFDENKGNMLTDTEFNISAQRLNGLQTGVASSQLQNKAMYQASLMAYAIAQVMMQNGLNANDTDAVSTFVANLSGTMLQKVYDIATTEEAKAGVATGKWMSPALVKAAIDKTLSDNDFLKKSGGTMTGAFAAPFITQTNYGAPIEIGQYIDFHRRGSSSDYDLRISLNDGGRNLVADIPHIGSFTIVDNGNYKDLGFPKIAIGSYVGTGTSDAYGGTKQNSLTFDFEPKMLAVVADGANMFFAGFLIVRGQTYSDGIGSFEPSSVGLNLHITWSGNTVSWWSSNRIDIGTKYPQMNVENITYRYVALG